jgi:histidinol-phosphatase (PHP family)
MLSNYHTHTTFCDGRASVDEMADDAAAKGFTHFGFSGHAPVPFPTKWAIERSELAAYAAAVRQCGKRLEGRVDIALGLEIDWIPGLSSPGDPAWEHAGLDYRLGSVHFVNPEGSERFTIDENEDDFKRHLTERYGGDAKRLTRDYYREIASLCASGGFDILGHFDLIRKNDGRIGFLEYESQWYRDAWMEACIALAECGAIAEINSGGMARGKTGSPYPSLEILKEFRARGIRVTLNADAHAPAHIGAFLEDSIALAKAAGYAETWFLSNGAWKPAPLGERYNAKPAKSSN